MPPRRKSLPPTQSAPTTPATDLTPPKRFQSFSELSAFIFNIANLLRGPYAPSEYRHVFIPMTVLRRLDCVLAPHKPRILSVYAGHQKDVRGQRNAEAEAEQRTLDDLDELSFFNTSPMNLAATRAGNVQDNLKAYLRGFSSNVRKLFEQFNLSAHIDRIASADPSLGLLDQVVATFVGVDLSP